jgi:hypothetical protein
MERAKIRKTLREIVHIHIVVPALVSGIHALQRAREAMDGRDKRGHDDVRGIHAK